jgi:hypothetical protein
MGADEDLTAAFLIVSQPLALMLVLCGFVLGSRTDHRGFNFDHWYSSILAMSDNGDDDNQPRYRLVPQVSRQHADIAVTLVSFLLSVP